jgi:hypothetical protein
MPLSCRAHAADSGGGQNVIGTSHLRRDVRFHAAARQAGTGLPVVLVVLIAVMTGAVAFIVDVLWPRWPEPMLGTDAPTLPITVAGVLLNVSPASIRVPVQRRPGAQERIDLAFLWPSLAPADPAVKLNATAAASNVLNRIFITIAAAGGTLAPEERVRSIYPHYASSEPVAGPPGLAILAFRDATPYQGEDLIYDAAMPANFLVRCTRPATTPGICLYERRIEAADLVARFPRDWLSDWQTVAGSIDRLI